MTPLLGPARAFALAERDLQAISARLETMHAEAWYPKQPDRDRPTPHLDPSSDPDHVPGITRDCGLGDEQVRQGWQRMVVHLHAADQTLTDVLCLAVGLESRLCAPLRASSLLDAQTVLKRLRSRHSDLQALWERWSGHEPTAPPTGRRSVTALYVDQPRATWLATQLMGPRTGTPTGPLEDIRQAMYEAQRVIPIVGSGKQPATCPQCRRLGSIGQPRRGGLCYGCDNQNTRSRRQRQTTVRAWRRDNRGAA